MSESGSESKQFITNYDGATFDNQQKNVQKIISKGEEWADRRVEKRIDNAVVYEWYDERETLGFALLKSISKQEGDTEFAVNDFRQDLISNPDVLNKLLVDYIDQYGSSIINDLPLNDKQKRLYDTFEEDVESKGRVLGDFIREKDGWQILSVPLLVQLAEFHRDDLNRKEAILKAEVSKVWDDVTGKIKDAIDSGKLPIDKQLFFERIDNIQILVLDELQSIIDGTAGDYHVGMNRMRISSDSSLNSISSTVMHELMHALSGQIETYYNLPNRFEGDVTQKTGHIKNGVSFMSGSKDSLIAVPKFDWLNEAITEKITMDLLSEDTGTYKEERELLNRLLSPNITEQDIHEAYFENLSEIKKGEHIAPKLKNLFNLFNEEYGQGFLVKLDMFIRSFDGDVKTVLKKWDEHGDRFPEYLSEWDKEY